ncbi:hypothetical protein LX36DRAFT_154153 [Colletotrichum falcatum]|nr:hypothetical protein LX36DRAFT_154153 [Colletotrichum falcatum]
MCAPPPLIYRVLCRPAFLPEWRRLTCLLFYLPHSSYRCHPIRQSTTAPAGQLERLPAPQPGSGIGPLGSPQADLLIIFGALGSRIPITQIFYHQIWNPDHAGNSGPGISKVHYRESHERRDRQARWQTVGQPESVTAFVIANHLHRRVRDINGARCKRPAGSRFPHGSRDHPFPYSPPLFVSNSLDPSELVLCR